MQGTRFRASSLAPVIDVEVAMTDTSFLTFKTLGTYPQNVLFVTVIARDLTYVLFPPSVVTDLRLVDSGGRGGISIGFVLLLLLVLLGLIGRSGILGRSRYRSLSLRLVPAIIFHCSLNLYFVCSSVGRLIPSGNMLVSLAYVGLAHKPVLASALTSFATSSS